jgi:tRNA(Glu) U13 pseudouridine synthase TruD
MLRRILCLEGTTKQGLYIPSLNCKKLSNAAAWGEEMSRFSAEFPVAPSNTQEDFIEAVRNWLSNSPHITFTEEQIRKIGDGAVSKVKSQGESVEVFRFEDLTDDVQSCAVVYSKRNDDITWKTEITFSKDHVDSWIGMSILPSASKPVDELPVVKKPRAIEYFLNKLGGSVDGLFNVESAPHYLSDKHLDLARQIVELDFEGRMPVVYLSSGFLTGNLLDAGALASDLAGLAHVVVEPNRLFSRQLQKVTQSKNVYGGTIGLYWPSTGTRDIFYQGAVHPDARSLKSAILEAVRSALANRSLQPRNTVQHTQAMVSAKTFADLRNDMLAGNRIELENWVSQFEGELKTKSDTIARLREQISELEAESRRTIKSKSGHLSIIVLPDTEQEFHDGEFAEILTDALKRQVDNEVSDGRRQHVLRAFVSSNDKGQAILEAKRHELKQILAGYSKMTAPVRNALEKMGFKVGDEGKHYKLTYLGDDRYTFTLAKSGSDFRGHKNAVSDISKRLF